MKERCIIVGAGTYGQVYAEYLKQEYLIEGFIDDDNSLLGNKVNGIEVVGDFDFLLGKIHKSINIFVPIGNNEVREAMLKKLNEAGFKTPNYIHPSANIDRSVKIAEKAVYILQNTVVMPLAEIKEGVMISAGTIISHHSVIESGVFVSFGVNIGASIKIDNKAYLGIGCTVMTGVKYLGKSSLIGAGSVIIRDVPEGATVVGNPGKIIKQSIL